MTLPLLFLTYKSKYVLAYINLWVFRNSLLSFLYRFVLDPTTLIALVLSSIIVRSCYISSMSSIFMKENQLKIQDNLLVQYKRIWFWKSSVNATKFIGKIPNSEFKNVKMTLCGFEKIWDPPPSWRIRDAFAIRSPVTWFMETPLVVMHQSKVENIKYILFWSHKCVENPS